MMSHIKQKDYTNQHSQYNINRTLCQLSPICCCCNTKESIQPSSLFPCFLQ